MKSIVIAGRLGKDPELRKTSNGDPVLSFSVAVDDGWGENKRTLWFDCSVFGKRGESLHQHLGKGAAVAVAGDLSTREHAGKTYLTVRANEVTLQGGGDRQSKQGAHAQRQARGGRVVQDLDDEIPFSPEWR